MKINHKKDKGKKNKQQTSAVEPVGSDNIIRGDPLPSSIRLNGVILILNFSLKLLTRGCTFPSLPLRTKKYNKIKIAQETRKKVTDQLNSGFRTWKSPNLITQKHSITQHSWIINLYN